VRLLEFLILAGVAWAGYAQAAGWWVLVGAAAMTLAGWARKIWLLRQHPQVPLSTKMTTYLVVSIGLNVVVATLALIAGRVLRWWLGG
jgi:hypothetical protein